MQNFIPHFIQENFQKRNFSGEFSAVSLLMDIAGFTSITETLINHEKEGADIISQIINTLFDAAIEEIYQSDGFVSTFAGDALTAIFPGKNIYQVLLISGFIQDKFHEFSTQKTKFGNFNISCKIGLSYGLISWGITGNDKQKSYYFKGPSIKNCARAQQKAEKGEIVFDEKILEQLDRQKIVYSSLGDELYLFNKLKTKVDLSKKQTYPSINKQILSQFISETIINYPGQGEFQKTVINFIAFPEEKEKSEFEAIITRIITLAQDFGGYFNSLDFGEKENLGLVVFGVPYSHEDDLKRAINYSLALKKIFRQKIKIGLNLGVTFAGVIGSPIRNTYSVLGEAVNLAARMAMMANWGEIWIPSYLLENNLHILEIQELGDFLIKGRTQRLKISLLLNEKERDLKMSYDNPFIGRIQELELLEENLGDALKKRFGGVFWVTGKIGSGKTRLIYEFTRKLDPSIRIIYLNTDGILKKSLNPFVRFFNNYFQLSQTNTAKENKVIFEQNYSDMLNRLDHIPDSERKMVNIKELKKIDSILGALLGILWEGSPYEKLYPEFRFENTIYAIKEFLKALSLLNPIILWVDDLHWLDPDSEAVLESLIHKIDDFPITILVSGRNPEQNPKPLHKLKGKLHTIEIELDNLDKENVHKFLKKLLKGNPSSGLLDYFYQITDGNPLHMEVLVEYLQRNYLLKLENREYIITNEIQEIPSDLNYLIKVKIEKLSPPLTEAVFAAAILGKEFDKKLLSFLVKEKNLAAILMEGEGEGIWSSLANNIFVFKQDLIREVAYQMQTENHLKDMHKSLAECLENLYQADKTYYVDILYNYELAGIKSKILQYSKKSAKDAHENFKSETALSFYDKWLAHSNSEYDNVRIYYKKAQILELSGQWHQAIEILQKGSSLAQENNLPRFNALFNSYHGEILNKKGDHENAISILEKALETAWHFSDMKVASKSLIHLAEIYFTRANFNLSLDYYQKALVIKRDFKDNLGEALCLYYMGRVCNAKGDHNTALKNFHDSELILKKINNKRFLTLPLYEQAIFYQRLGELDKAYAFFTEARYIFDEIGDKSKAQDALLNLGIIRQKKGEFDQALKLCRESLDLAEIQDNKIAMAFTLFSIGVIYFEKKNYPRTLNFFRKSLGIMTSIESRSSYGYILAYLTTTYAHLGKSKDALKTAYYHLKNMIRIGSDVEHGRTYLGIALALANDKNINNLTLSYLEKIKKFTKLSDDAESYFKKAIEVSEKKGYLNTWIPALFEYGKYLLAANNGHEKAMVLMAQSRSLALASGMMQEVTKINEFLEKV
jgi:class 3 adenylate cyclase/tetratricopeptide (TPR) repeat protein